jgi:HK97 family phage portal protein
MQFAQLIPRFLRGGIQRVPGEQLASPLVTFKGKRSKVSEDTALQISAVWAAVNLKASTIASMALRFYRMTPSGRMDEVNHPLARLFSGKPNRYQTRLEFFETVGLNLYLSGNSYCRITRDRGQIVSLLPLMSSQMDVELMPNGDIVYTYNDGTNISALSAQNIWHLKLTSNGVKGLSPLQYAANAIGMAITGEEWSSNVVGNGGKPTGVLMYDKILTKEQREQLRDRFRDLREGPTDALMTLEAGMKYEQISLSPQDVQLLEARRFQIEDIARFFGVPSVMINDTAGGTVWGSGIQQIIEGWYKLALRTELERIEASIVSNLLAIGERDQISVEFDFDELLRSSFADRVETGSKAVNNGLMTRNEWREREWLPAAAGADTLTAGVNLAPITSLGEGQDGDASAI